MHLMSYCTIDYRMHTYFMTSCTRKLVYFWLRLLSLAIFDANGCYLFCSTIIGLWSTDKSPHEKCNTRERHTLFLMSQVVDRNGEFHCANNPTFWNKCTAPFKNSRSVHVSLLCLLNLSNKSLHLMKLVQPWLCMHVRFYMHTKVEQLMVNLFIHTLDLLLSTCVIVRFETSAFLWLPGVVFRGHLVCLDQWLQISFFLLAASVINYST